MESKKQSTKEQIQWYLERLNESNSNDNMKLREILEAISRIYSGFKIL